MILIVENTERYRKHYNKHPCTHHLELLLLTFYLICFKYFYMNEMLKVTDKVGTLFSLLLSPLPLPPSSPYVSRLMRYRCLYHVG